MRILETQNLTLADIVQAFHDGQWQDFRGKLSRGYLYKLRVRATGHEVYYREGAVVIPAEDLVIAPGMAVDSLVLPLQIKGRTRRIVLPVEDPVPPALTINTGDGQTKHITSSSEVTVKWHDENQGTIDNPFSMTIQIDSLNLPIGMKLLTTSKAGTMSIPALKFETWKTYIITASVQRGALRTQKTDSFTMVPKNPIVDLGTDRTVFRPENFHPSEYSDLATILRIPVDNVESKDPGYVQLYINGQAGQRYQITRNTEIGIAVPKRPGLYSLKTVSSRIGSPLKDSVEIKLGVISLSLDFPPRAQSFDYVYGRIAVNGLPGKSRLVLEDDFSEVSKTLTKAISSSPATFRLKTRQPCDGYLYLESEYLTERFLLATTSIVSRASVTMSPRRTNLREFGIRPMVSYSPAKDGYKRGGGEFHTARYNISGPQTPGVTSWDVVYLVRDRTDHFVSASYSQAANNDFASTYGLDITAGKARFEARVLGATPLKRSNTYLTWSVGQDYQILANGFDQLALDFERYSTDAEYDYYPYIEIEKGLDICPAASVGLFRDAAELGSFWTRAELNHRRIRLQMLDLSLPEGLSEAAHFILTDNRIRIIVGHEVLLGPIFIHNSAAILDHGKLTIRDLPISRRSLK